MMSCVDLSKIVCNEKDVIQKYYLIGGCCILQFFSGVVLIVWFVDD